MTDQHPLFFRQNVSRFLSHSSWYERRSVRQTASAATAAATSAAMRTVEAATRRWAHLDARSKRRTRRLAARHSSSKYESEDRWRHVTIRNGISQVSPWSHCHTKAPDHRRCCLPTFLVDRAATKTAQRGRRHDQASAIGGLQWICRLATVDSSVPSTGAGDGLTDQRLLRRRTAS